MKVLARRWPIVGPRFLLGNVSRSRWPLQTDAFRRPTGDWTHRGARFGNAGTQGSFRTRTAVAIASIWAAEGG
eukprot:4160099-Prymnesium_polylepis.1